MRSLSLCRLRGPPRLSRVAKGRRRSASTPPHRPLGSSFECYVSFDRDFGACCQAPRTNWACTPTAPKPTSADALGGRWHPSGGPGPRAALASPCAISGGMHRSAAMRLARLLARQGWRVRLRRCWPRRGPAYWLVVPMRAIPAACARASQREFRHSLLPLWSLARAKPVMSGTVLISQTIRLLMWHNLAGQT